MAFCSSCNTANPNEAKFCAHCGLPLPAAAPKPQPQARPAPSPQPELVTGRQAFQQKPAHDLPGGVEPDPRAPGQTQFFVAAAGVSTSSKIKRVVLFLVGAIVIGVVIFFGLRFALKASNESLKSRVPSESAQSQPNSEPTAAASPSTDQPDQPAANLSDTGKPSKGK